MSFALPSPGHQPTRLGGDGMQVGWSSPAWAATRKKSNSPSIVPPPRKQIFASRRPNDADPIRLSFIICVADPDADCRRRVSRLWLLLHRHGPKKPTLVSPMF